MHGHEQLIAMRLHGYMPDQVWIGTDLGERIDQARDWLAMNSAVAHLQLDAPDKPARLDLRCVHGLMCFVQGSDAHTVHAVRDACIEAGAKRVISAVMERFGRGEWAAFRTIEQTDTDGQFVWPQPEEIDG